MMEDSFTEWPTRRRLVLLALALLASSTVLGATLQPQSLEQLVRDAELIVRGQVKDITPGPRGERAPSTIVMISVQGQWKGIRLSTLRLVQPRGTEGEITLDVPGLPMFRVGEEVILFVVQEARGQYHVLGGKQGKFSIKTDPRSGKQVVEDLTGARFDLTQFLSRLSALTKVAP